MLMIVPVLWLHPFHICAGPLQEKIITDLKEASRQSGPKFTLNTTFTLFGDAN